MPEAEAEAVLEFWFGASSRDPAAAHARRTFWYQPSAVVDQEITARFSGTLARAAGGTLQSWRYSPRGALALIVVLDQFSRNIHRATADAFAQDASALSLALAGVEQGQDRQLQEVERSFFYLPFQHAEHPLWQERSLDLYQRLIEEARPPFVPFAEYCYGFAREHAAVIARFGRFPHRNQVLQRVSTPQEEAYLRTGGKTYGQVKTTAQEQTDGDTNSGR